MDPRLLSLAWCLFTASLVSSTAGPVFVNPADAVVATPSPSANQGNYVTQTVYGFLDFTTTIGNTIMVFSPQSAAIPSTEPPKEDVKVNVIDSKPPSIQKSEEVIKPSKTQPQPVKKSPTTVQEKKIISSVVQVHSSKVEVVKSPPNTKIVEVKPAPPPPPPKVISSKVEVVSPSPSIITKIEIVSSPPVISSKVEIVTSSKEVEAPIVDEPVAILGNNIGEPEYDFLSRQPSEVVEETYKVINLKPSSKFHLKPRTSADKKATKRADSIHPTGLVTKLGGTVVKDGTTTVHETSVIGTYISGKYAQVLQSTSHIQHGGKQQQKITPSATLKILKTAAPSLGAKKQHHHHHRLEPTPAGSVNSETALPADFNSHNAIKSTRKPPQGGGFKPRFKNRKQEAAEVEEETGEQDVAAVAPHSNYKKSQQQQQRPRAQQNNRNSKHNTSSHSPHKFGRGSRKTATTTTTRPVSVHSEEPSPSSPTKRFQSSRRNKQQQQQQQQQRASSSTSEAGNNGGGGYSRRGYKPKVQTSTVEQYSASTSLYKFKLNRSPGRWQYKTTPKPRVTIRKQNDDEDAEDDQEQQQQQLLQKTTPSTPPETSPQLNDLVTPQARSDDVDGLEGSESVASIIDDQGSTENKLDAPFPLETLKVEISTPPDFKDIYYEIATIKSPYTFKVGNVKNTRYITVTSTFEKSLVNTPEPTISPTASEPLTENILATSTNYGKDNNFLDSSVATLPPIYLASDMETPPLETLTETFSTTQTMLKTHILPIIRNANETATSTLVQTYLVTRLVTATKTLPPMEAYHFNPSRTLNEFNSRLDEAGSELHLELEFGDQNDQEEPPVFPDDLNLANVGSDFNLSDVDKSRLPANGHLRPKKAPKPVSEAPPPLNPDQLQQLALLRLLNPGAAQQGQVVTTSRPVIKIETVYESHVIPIINGPNTLLSTISKVLGTVTKTDYEFGTSTIAPALPLPPVPVNPLFPQAQPQFAITTSPIVQSTFVTQTNSKILKLTFGAKTTQTTIFSTRVVPTLVTTFVTASVPVAPTAAFPGFFPGPYPGYPYVG